MKRSKPLRRSRFKTGGPDIEREVKPWAATLSATTIKPIRAGSYSGETTAKPKTPKMLQHAGYMAAVRDLGYCMLCRRACRPQFCHRDQTKGMGIKTDCREGWPGCDECHWRVGTSGEFPKEERRALELDLGRRTREAVKAAGSWPARLAEWREPC